MTEITDSTVEATVDITAWIDEDTDITNGPMSVGMSTHPAAWGTYMKIPARLGVLGDILVTARFDDLADFVDRVRAVRALRAGEDA